MKKKIVPVLWFAIPVAAVLFLLFFTAVFYYRKGFGPGIFINSIYCTGKSVEEVNSELIELCGRESFSVQDAFGRSYEIPLSSIRFEIDYTSQLKGIKMGQAPFYWMQYILGSSHKEISPTINIDENLLKEALKESGLFQDNKKEDIVEIRPEEGYILYDGRKNVFNEDMAIDLVKNSLQQGNMEVDVSSCYEDLPYTAKMLETLALYDKISAFVDCKITYHMGDTLIPIGPETISGWIEVNEEGNPILREGSVEAFIDELCKEYNTYNTTRTFQSTRGENITIEGGTYGNKIDRNAEIAYLTQAILNHVKEVHIPAYEKIAYVRGKEDIKDTYVEVDMTMQKLYYYEEGELLFESDIVTGHTGQRMGTPSGVNFVYDKQRNRVLRGPGYESPVKYWVPVAGSIGIHDASWRKKFGEEIYKTNGSHGCINVPSSVMEELYDMLEIGIPVIMFY